jgi:FixJ family two-component response regulator
MSARDIVAIVDDDDRVRYAVEGLLRAAGFRVAAFAAAEEFLQSGDLRATACLIVDLRMPGMSGLELQRRLIDDGHRLPIIIVTAHPDAGARASALERGAAAFLPKPFDGERLVAAVESAVGRR